MPERFEPIRPRMIVAEEEAAERAAARRFEFVCAIAAAAILLITAIPVLVCFVMTGAHL